MKSKRFSIPSYLILASIVFFGINAYADNIPLTVTISGPRSCVALGTPLTYTGTHSPGSNQCTFHTWTVTGGSIILNGFNVGNTLCLTENVEGCASDGDSECSGLIPMTNPSTSIITVVWNPGISTGTLKLKVKEGTLSGQRTITVTTGGKIVDITQTGGTCTTGTYLATISNGCPIPSGFWIEWSIGNGPILAVGNPVTFTLPTSGNGMFTVNAKFASNPALPIGTSGFYSEAFQTSKPVSMAGPTFVNEQSYQEYTLGGGGGITSTTWGVNSSTYGSVTWSTLSQAGINFGSVNATQYVQVTASGSSFYCPSWAYNLSVIINNSIQLKRPDNGSLTNDDIQEIQLDPSSEKEVDNDHLTQNTATGGVSKEKPRLFPTIITPTSSVLKLNLPDSNQPYSITIYDLNGRTHLVNKFEGNNIEMPVDALPNGMYLVRIEGDGFVETEKIVVSN